MMSRASREEEARPWRRERFIPPVSPREQEESEVFQTWHRRAIEVRKEFLSMLNLRKSDYLSDADAVAGTSEVSREIAALRSDKLRSFMWEEWAGTGCSGEDTLYRVIKTGKLPSVRDIATPFRRRGIPESPRLVLTPGPVYMAQLRDEELANGRSSQGMGNLPSSMASLPYSIWPPSGKESPKECERMGNLKGDAHKLSERSGKRKLVLEPGKTDEPNERKKALVAEGKEGKGNGSSSWIKPEEVKLEDIIADGNESSRIKTEETDELEEGEIRESEDEDEAAMPVKTEVKEELSYDDQMLQQYFFSVLK